jgi:hypothetical protein
MGLDINKLMAKWQNQKEQEKTKGQGKKGIIKIEEDKVYRIIITPELESYGDVAIPLMFHYKISGTHLCLKKNRFLDCLPEGNCPACEWVDALYASGTDQDKKQAYDVRARPRYVSWAIERGNEKLGVQKIYMNEESYQNIRAFMQAKPKRIIDITDLKTGRDLMFRKTTGKGSFPYFIAQVDPEPSNVLDSISERELNRMIDERPPIVDEADIISYDEFATMVSAAASGEQQSYQRKAYDGPVISTGIKKTYAQKAEETEDEDVIERSTPVWGKADKSWLDGAAADDPEPEDEPEVTTPPPKAEKVAPSAAPSGPRNTVKNMFSGKKAN